MLRYALLISLSSLGLIHTAAAQQPAYAGRWASEAGWCRNKLGTTDEIPMRFTARGVEGFEFACTFDKVGGGNGRWDIAATCRGEGMTEKRRINLSRDGDVLVWSERGKPSRRLSRCG
ncbi:hypothetical protein ASE66_16455 [Bosea sp. Root483D1]|uniref:hypothetical protein n=1 Tax=Bosea sp. Root483D1 TaxID=1736544 RepID=UPI00070CA1A9|nr:hypothetical protein [Bosea sp. Root483D1]KRE13775.1 hypothetical protein ASE66_16455 [Bosea sp. Root483D1]